MAVNFAMLVDLPVYQVLARPVVFHPIAIAAHSSKRAGLLAKNGQ